MLAPIRSQHTNTLDRAAQGGAPCSTSYVERSDRLEEPVRPVAVQNDDDPTNAHPGGTPSGQARTVALGSAGQIGCPQMPWRRKKNIMLGVGKASVKRKGKDDKSRCIS